MIGKVALNNHKRRHKTPVVRNLQKKNKCDICPYESADKSHVNRHKKQVLRRWKSLGIVNNVKRNFHWSMDMIDVWKYTRQQPQVTNTCVVNAIKHLIRPSAWRGTWWADFTKKSQKRKRAEQLSCAKWESFCHHSQSLFLLLKFWDILDSWATEQKRIPCREPLS